jgi:hypothetical protein
MRGDQDRPAAQFERVAELSIRFQPDHPAPDQILDYANIQRFVKSGISAQVDLREFEQRDCRLAPLFLNVNECSGELNQPLIKEVVGLSALCQPQLFEHFVGLKEELPIKTLKITDIMSIELPALMGMNQGSNLGGFMTHGANATGFWTD